MSRNICETVCQHCGATPVLTEAPRPITRDDAGRYFAEFRGLLVANAECPMCCAKYLAWVDDRGRPRDAVRGILLNYRYCGEPFFDLSYRSTFNDEPGKADLPTREPAEMIRECLAWRRFAKDRGYLPDVWKDWVEE